MIMTACLLSVLLSFSSAARAGDKPAALEQATADKATVELVRYFLKVPAYEVDTKLVGRFLAVDAGTLPQKIRGKALAKQAEIRDLINIHDTKKAGSLIQPKEGCSEKDFVVPLEQAAFYAGYEEVNEDELKYVKDKTKCTEIDLGCRFSLKIFFKKGKDRRLMFVPADPIMAVVAESHKGGTTNFFGMGFTCMH